MNEIITVKGIDCYEENGVAFLSLEAVARGLGFVKTDRKDGVEYERVNKQFLRGQLQLFGILNSESETLPSYIPENVFYRLAMKAKNETAEKFQALIADEVIPSIRKHGAYMTPEKLQEVLLNPDTLIQLASNLKDEQEKNKRLTAKVEQDAPKVLFADSVACSNTEILVGELAKILKQNGMDIGQNRLFERLRQDGYLIARKGSDYNMPTQRSMEMGLIADIELVKTLGIIQNGQVDYYSLFNAAMAQIKRQGKLVWDVLLIGRLSFDEQDLRDLHQCIIRQGG